MTTISGVSINIFIKFYIKMQVILHPEHDRKYYVVIIKYSKELRSNLIFVHHVSIKS